MPARFRRPVGPPPRRRFPDLSEIQVVQGYGNVLQQDVDDLIRELNALIVQYNSAHSVSGSGDVRTILSQIQSRIKSFDDKYPESYLLQCPEYCEMYNKIFEEDQYQYRSLGQMSLANQDESPLTKIIADMSQDKADALATILASSKKNLLRDLKTLYIKNDSSDEAEAFRLFLKTHEISFLGGQNSKNFKVTNIHTGASQVLKIDNRLHMPKAPDTFLRDNTNFLAPIYAARQVRYNNRKELYPGMFIEEPNRSTLQVTEYYTSGSVADLVMTTHPHPNEIAKKIHDTFIQMSEIMIKIETKRLIFPDAKLANWLINDHGKLIIADTKSPAFIGKDGAYSKELPANKFCRWLLKTPGFTPPEIEGEKSSEGCKASAVHAYILGQNILYGVVGFSGNVQVDNMEDLPFFKTKIGKAYKSLIDDLMKENPNKRLSIHEAHKHLKFLGLLSELEALKFGSNDSKMDDFIAQKLHKMRLSPGTYQTIVVDLERTVTNLKANKASSEIRTVIQNFNDSAGLFTVGMRKKATKIEQAMSHLSIEERSNFRPFQQDNTPNQNKVLEALASHRHVGRKEVYLKDDTVDEKKAARTYTLFKKKLAETSHQSKPPDQASEGHKP